MANTIKIGSIEADAIKIGTSTVSKVYVGTELVYPTDVPHDYSQDYLTFVAETDNVSFQFTGGVNGNTFQYSTDDGSTWNNVSIGQTTSSINTGDKILFKASGLSVNTTNGGIGTIKPSGNASVHGNIMSLVYGDNFSGQTALQNGNQFKNLFDYAVHITSAENMVFPATTLSNNCYNYMFRGCTSLVLAPKILPAMTLTSACYADMFYGCTSLTTAPELPAATLTQWSYTTMFYGCSSLHSITCLATNISANSCTQNWVQGVAASGTFTKATSMSSWTTGNNGIPNGWTVQNV